MNVVSYLGGRKTADYARSFATIAGKVFREKERDGEIVDSVLIFFDPEQTSSDEASIALQAWRRRGAIIGMYPVASEPGVPEPGDLFRRGILTGRGGDVLTYFGFSESQALSGSSTAFGRDTWAEFVAEARQPRNALIVHTHGSAACFAFGGAALCERVSASQLSKHRCLPCQAGGECFRSPQLTYLGAEAIGGPIVAFLSCLAVSFSDTLVAHRHTFIRRLLESNRTAAVLTSFRVASISSLECAFAEWLLQTGYSLGEVTAALNELTTDPIPRFICLGDPDIRASVPANRLPSWRMAAKQAIVQLQRGSELDRDRWLGLQSLAHIWKDEARDEVRDSLARALGAALLSGSCGSETTDSTKSIEPLTSAVDGTFLDYMGLLCAGLDSKIPSERDSIPAFATDTLTRWVSKNCCYVHNIWSPSTRVRGERLRGRHACGATLYTIHYENQVLRAVDFQMWVCLACGVVGYTSNERTLPTVSIASDGSIEVGLDCTDKFWVGSAVEPLRVLSANPTPTQLECGGNWKVHPARMNAPGLNWLAIVACSLDELICLRIPVVRAGDNWRLAYSSPQPPTAHHDVTELDQTILHDACG